MRFGVYMFPTRYSIGPAELARAVEERGFESLFFPEHTHIPVSRRSPWPGGGELPEEYRQTLDPFLALTAAAAVTDRLLLGTGICLVVERDPITTAKEVATLDLLSGGRFLFGVGGGWNREEMENHGTDPTRRFAVMRERILAMKEIWTNDEAEFHGAHVDFDALWAWPKPLQQPHPPVLVAGNGPGTLDRVMEYGDGWIPIPGRGSVTLGEGTARLREMAAERGRPPVPVTVFGASTKPEVLDHYAEAGVDRVLFTLPSVEAAEAIKLLDTYANIAETERS
ncbi:MAG TPA: LLM class F420-dependent oxidoreductase [Acidimicrobiia bacterium]|nr:LLM class F420-dependent oxidoreductase [Acidimicrobiia bacterium]